MKTKERSYKIGIKRTGFCAEMIRIPQEKAGFLCFLNYLSVSPRLASARAVPATAFFHNVAAKIQERSGKWKKDVKIEGTNPTSPLESPKPPKNEPKTNSKNVLKTREKLKMRSRNAPKNAAGIGHCRAAEERE